MNKTKTNTSTMVHAKDLESQRTELLKYSDSQCILLSIKNYIGVLIQLGKTKHKGKRLFKTKGLKKMYKKIYCYEALTTDLLTIGQAAAVMDLHEELLSMLKKQENRINIVTGQLENIDCSDLVLDILFGAGTMIKDIKTAFNQLPQIIANNSEERKSDLFNLAYKTA